MAFFKFLFYLILFILIKIGDLVNGFLGNLKRLFTFPTEIITRTINNFFYYVFVKPFGNKRTKYRKNKYTIRSVFSKLLIPIVQFFRFIVKILKTIEYIFVFPMAGIVNAMGSVGRGFIYPLRFLKHRKSRRGRPKLPFKNHATILFRLKYLFIGGFAAFVLFFIPATFFIFISDLPKLSNLSINYIPKTTKILDRNGNLLFEIYSSQNRTIVSIDKIPKQLQEATISIEDKDFYKHSGFDIRGIGRALYVNLSKGQLQGGSTITQQLIKSALLTPEPTLIRKTRELVLAFWAERKYTKKQILELYFNYVPYGGAAWGIEAASQIYFGKDVWQLSLAESAYLAGLPRAPSIYSPFISDGTEGKKRQKEVLLAMVRDGYISQKQAEDASSQKLTFLPPQVPIKAPHFVMYVKDLLIRKYGLFEVERGGLQVTTSLDLDTQKMAEEIVSNEVDNSQYLGVGNGAALITNPQNGDILAMVGSRDYFDSNHDGNVNLTTSLRQPGSTIKLITYSLALSKGFTESTILDDLPITIYSTSGEAYSPVNYDGAFHGRIPLRIAFANSFNIPAVRVAQKLGVDQIVDFGHKMGISSWKTSNNYGLSITLGAAETTMVDLATAYGVIANKGERVDVDPILEVKDSEGKVLEEKQVSPQRVISPGVAFIISDILADNKARSIEFGSNSPLNIAGQRVSVKTGTTDNKRDNWTIGFTPDLVVAAWVGNNDNTPLNPALASGITGAAPIWSKIMTALLKTDPTSLTPDVPNEVISKQCYNYTAYFIRGTEDKSPCNYTPPTPTPQQQ